MKEIPEIYKKLAESRHLFIGGSTGSGKSVALNALIDCIAETHKDARFLLIDPKCVECAAAYEKLTKQGIRAERFCDMSDAWAALEKLDDSETYVFIDEYADMAVADPKCAVERMRKIMEKEGVHVYLTTQRPTLCPKSFVSLFDVLALRCADSAASTRMLDSKNASALRLGQGIYKKNGESFPVTLPYYR